MIRALLACLSLGGCAPMALYGVPVRLGVMVVPPSHHHGGLHPAPAYLTRRAQSSERAYVNRGAPQFAPDRVGSTLPLVLTGPVP